MALTRQNLQNLAAVNQIQRDLQDAELQLDNITAYLHKYDKKNASSSDPKLPPLTQLIRKFVDNVRKNIEENGNYKGFAVTLSKESAITEVRVTNTNGGESVVLLDYKADGAIDRSMKVDSEVAAMFLQNLMVTIAEVLRRWKTGTRPSDKIVEKLKNSNQVMLDLLRLQQINNANGSADSNKAMLTNGYPAHYTPKNATAESFHPYTKQRFMESRGWAKGGVRHDPTLTGSTSSFTSKSHLKSTGSTSNGSTTSFTSGSPSNGSTGSTSNGSTTSFTSGSPSNGSTGSSSNGSTGSISNGSTGSSSNASTTSFTSGSTSNGSTGSQRITTRPVAPPVNRPDYKVEDLQIGGRQYEALKATEGMPFVSPVGHICDYVRSNPLPLFSQTAYNSVSIVEDNFQKMYYLFEPLIRRWKTIEYEGSYPLSMRPGSMDLNIEGKDRMTAYNQILKDDDTRALRTQASFSSMSSTPSITENGLSDMYALKCYQIFSYLIQTVFDHDVVLSLASLTPHQLDDLVLHDNAKFNVTMQTYSKQSETRKEVSTNVMSKTDILQTLYRALLFHTTTTDGSYSEFYASLPCCGESVVKHVREQNIINPEAKDTRVVLIYSLVNALNYFNDNAQQITARTTIQMALGKHFCKHAHLYFSLYSLLSTINYADSSMTKRYIKNHISENSAITYLLLSNHTPHHYPNIRLLTYVENNGDYPQHAIIRYNNVQEPFYEVDENGNTIPSDWVKSKFPKILSAQSITLDHSDALVGKDNYFVGPFDRIFVDDNAPNDIANMFIYQALPTFRKGKPIVLLGYGASGAGKTSALVQRHEQPGALIKICGKIMVSLQSCELTLECYEIRRPPIGSDTPTVLHITSDDGGDKMPELRGPYKLQNDAITSGGRNLADALQQMIDAKRLTRATPNNDNSSRSHVLVQLLFKWQEQGVARQNVILLCDFAGMENEFDCRFNSRDLKMFHDVYKMKFDRRTLKRASKYYDAAQVSSDLTGNAATEVDTIANKKFESDGFFPMSGGGDLPSTIALIDQFQSISQNLVNGYTFAKNETSIKLPTIVTGIDWTTGNSHVQSIQIANNMILTAKNVMKDSNMFEYVMSSLFSNSKIHYKSKDYDGIKQRCIQSITRAWKLFELYGKIKTIYKDLTSDAPTLMLTSSLVSEDQIHMPKGPSTGTPETFALGDRTYTQQDIAVLYPYTITCREYGLNPRNVTLKRNDVPAEFGTLYSMVRQTSLFIEHLQKIHQQFVRIRGEKKATKGLLNSAYTQAINEHADSEKSPICKFFRHFCKLLDVDVGMLEEGHAFDAIVAEKLLSSDNEYVMIPITVNNDNLRSQLGRRVGSLEKNDIKALSDYKLINYLIDFVYVRVYTKQFKDELKRSLSSGHLAQLLDAPCNGNLAKCVTDFFNSKSDVANKRAQVIDNMVAVTFLVLDAYQRNTDMMRICELRLLEGKFINESLKGLQAFIDEVIAEKASERISSIPVRFRAICDGQWKRADEYRAFTKKNVHRSNRQGGSNVYGILKKYIKKLTQTGGNASSSGQDFLLVVLGVLNTTSNAPSLNPPAIPYIDIINVKRVLSTYATSRVDDKNIQDRYVKLVKELEIAVKTFESIGHHDSTLIDQFNITRLVLAKHNGRDVTATDYATRWTELVTIATDLVKFVDINNASSALGTVEYVDRLSKENRVDYMCKFNVESKIFADRATKLNFRPIYSRRT